MITELSTNEIDQVVELHTSELPGLLSLLGKPFLKKFYTVSLTLEDLSTYVYKEKRTVMGFATGALSTKNLYKKIFFKDPWGFLIILLFIITTRPLLGLKLINLLFYPGFSTDTAELLSLAVSREYQKKGIGTKLLTAVIKEFKKKNVPEFCVSIYSRLPSDGFYKKSGFIFNKSFQFLGEEMKYYTFIIQKTRKLSNSQKFRKMK